MSDMPHARDCPLSLLRLLLARWHGWSSGTARLRRGLACRRQPGGSARTFCATSSTRQAIRKSARSPAHTLLPAVTGARRHRAGKDGLEFSTETEKTEMTVTV